MQRRDRARPLVLDNTSRVARALAACGAVLVGTASAQSRTPFDLAMDARGRAESDVHSTRENGIERDDRTRLRTRVRAELRVRPANGVTFAVRARTGLRASQQSPHLTVADLTEGPRDAFQGSLDRYYGEVTRGRFRAWGGRNEFPFFTYNEVIWDRDVTVAGGFVSTTWASNRRGSLEARGAWFALPDGAIRFAGSMGAAQLVASRARPASTFIAGVGYLGLRRSSAGRHLIDGNGRRDYDLMAVSTQFERKVGLPHLHVLRVGADVWRNVRSYPVGGGDRLAAANHDQRDGMVVGASVGERRGSRALWEAGYTFARVEKLALNASFASDDWVRWGSGAQTDASDFVGHEITGRWWLWRDLDLHARVFFVESITTVQDGTRVRLDVNWRFARTL